MRGQRRLAAGAGAALLVAAMVAYGLAQPGSFDPRVSGPTGGGGRSTGGPYALEGVIGQAFLGTSAGQLGTGPLFSLDAGILGGFVRAVVAGLRIPLVAKD